MLEGTGWVDIIAGVYAHLLGIEGGHIGHAGVEVYVGHQRGVETVGTQGGVNVLQVFSLTCTLCGEAHQLSASAYNALGLFYAGLRVVGVGGGHRLHTHGGSTTYLQGAYLYGARGATMIIKNVDIHISLVDELTS